MHTQNNKNANRLILGISFLQGILMYVLYRALEAKVWPANDPVWLTAIICALGAIPVFFVLLVDEENPKSSVKFLALYGVLITSAGAYAGLQVLPTQQPNNELVYVAFMLTMGIATFKALMYSQVLSRGIGVRYSELFHYSWRNMLLFALACLFTLLFLGVLLLWANLFQLININLFQDVFEEEWFLLPAATTAFGFAVIIFRNLGNIIENVTRLLLTMIRFLLPVLALLAVVFVCFLPFTGLQPLWDTRFGSTMMLWLQALLLFAVNAVYQSESEDHPYSLYLHRLIYAGIVVMPVYSIIAFHGLLTRISQHGLTVSRCWGLMVAFFLACFAIGYLVSIIRKRDAWLAGLAKVNIAMGLVVMAMMILVNSPLLNLQALSASSQLARVENGKITPEELDLEYFRYSLGKQGYLALEEFKTLYGENHPELVTRIDNLYTVPEFQDAPLTTEDIESRLTVWPENREVPQAVLETMLQQGISGVSRYFAVFSDMNKNGSEDILVFLDFENSFTQPTLYTMQDNGWRSVPVRMDRYIDAQSITTALANGDVEIEQPAWLNLRIGDAIYTPVEENNSP